MKHLTKLLAAAGVATLALAGCGGGGSSTAATAGQGERCDSRRSEELREVLHECFPPLMWILP